MHQLRTKYGSHIHSFFIHKTLIRSISDMQLFRALPHTPFLKKIKIKKEKEKPTKHDQCLDMYFGVLCLDNFCESFAKFYGRP